MIIVYLIAGTYRAAGMERVLADKANWLASRGHKVHVITTDQQGRPHAFAMDPSIQFRDLDINYEENNGGSFLSKILKYPGKQMRHRRRLAKALKEIRADIVVSMFCNDVGFLPRIKDGSRKVLEVHFSRFKRLQYGRTGLWAMADKWRSMADLRHVRAYDRFVVLTEEDRGYWGDLPNMVVIPNSVSLKADGPAPLTGKTVIAVGRYSYQKALDRLIDAWKIIMDRLGPDSGWRLRLVGDGETRPQLEAQIVRLGLQDSIELGKVEKDMASVYHDASILALSSRYEGLPMVLLEAQSFGVPCVSFDCKCGPKDVIHDGENGLLVPEGDVPALAEALLKLMQDPEGLKNMGGAAYIDATRWQPDLIMQQWIDLFESVLSSRR